MSIVTLSVATVHSRRLPRWKHLKALLRECHQRVHSRYELASLDDRELSDLGLTRMDADNEANKPFWQA